MIKNYVDVPPNYRDETGLDYSREDLTAEQILDVFGPSTSTPRANLLLRILHGRRVAGTLDDPAYRINTAHYRKFEVETALAWLRQNVPVDEVVNAGLRAEDELRDIERALEEERKKQEEAASGEGGAADNSVPATGSDKGTVETPQSGIRLYQDRAPDDVYGQGVIDRIRARNEARWEVEQKRREKERKEREEEDAKHNIGPLAKVEGGGRQMSVRMKAWQEAAASPLKEPPKMAKWERLLPSVALVLLLAGALHVVAQVYQPPPQSARLWPELPPASATVLTLIGANLLVFALWRFPPLYGFMNRYFIVVPATPKPLSMVGAFFSHQKFGHMLSNMLFLWFFGTRLHEEVGRAEFLSIYFASGCFGFLASMSNIVLRNNLHLTTLGASGAVFGIAAAYFTMHRFDNFKIFDLPPEPYTGIQGLGFLGLMLGLQIVAMTGRNKLVDVLSHLGGMAAGAAYGYYAQQKKEQRAAAGAAGAAQQDSTEGKVKRFEMKMLESKIAEGGKTA